MLVLLPESVLYAMPSSTCARAFQHHRCWRHGDPETSRITSRPEGFNNEPIVTAAAATSACCFPGRWCLHWRHENRKNQPAAKKYFCHADSHMKNSPVILLTGASGGVGQAAARACAQQGARIAVHFHTNQQAADNLISDLPGSGHRPFAADITDPDAVLQLVNQVYSEMGQLDVLVNNAGISERHDITSIDYATWQATWQRIMATNLTAAANLSYCAAQVMLAQGGGRIVNVSSRGAFRGEPNMPWYGASKAGLNAMGQSLAQALGDKHIYVYTVAPGFIETPMAAAVLAGAGGDAVRQQSTLGRVAQPAEVGEVIRYLALQAPAFMTGGIIDVNGASYLRT
jgi:3-oxoacyl-[acyl-carrier protein] reductase